MSGARKRLLGAIVAAAVLGGGAWLYLRRGGEPAGGSEVPTVAVAEERLVRRVNAEGNLRALKATPLIVPKTSGDGTMKIAWLAPDGGRIKQGDVVVRFDRSGAEKQLVDGQADLESATARRRAEQIKSGAAVAARDTAAKLAAEELEQTRRFQSKDKEIFSRNQIIESEIDERLASARKQHAEQTKAVERDLSRSKVELIAVEQQKAEIAINHAKSALDSMELKAPHGGLFVLQRNWRGEYPKLGQQMWPGQRIADIPLLETMEAEVFVLEIDGSGLAEKQRAEIVIEAHPETAYRGTVRLVDKLAKPRIDGVPIQYFAVVIELEKTDPAAMKPGQRVRARLILDEDRALAVPRQAVQNKDGKSFVYRRTPRGEFESVPVELGAATSGRVVVTRGLAAGDVIALRDPTRSVEQALGSGEPAGAAGPGGKAEGRP
jgi:multidrug efflux pump subunit AcrA (membrane-fusion protein)